MSHLITSVAGSSAYFNGAIVAYHNQFKISELGVKREILNTEGAVSEEAVGLLAKNVREKFGTGYGLATSGGAGASGGSAEKPVGTVWLACDYDGGTVTKKLQLSDDRAINIHLSATYALDLLRKCLSGE